MSQGTTFTQYITELGSKNSQIPASLLVSVANACKLIAKQVEQGALAGMAALWAFQRLNQVDAPPRVVYTQPQTVYVERPVVVHPQVVEYQRQQCSPWVETRNWDGTVTRSRTCNY